MYWERVVTYTNPVCPARRTRVVRMPFQPSLPCEGEGAWRPLLFIVSVETRTILGSVFLFFHSCLHGDFSDVIKSKHDNLTMQRLVEVLLHAFLMLTACYGEWTAEVSSRGTSPRRSRDTSRIWGWLCTRSCPKVVVGRGMGIVSVRVRNRAAVARVECSATGQNA